MKFRVMRGESVQLSGGPGGKHRLRLDAVNSCVELTDKAAAYWRDAIRARVAEGTMRPADDAARALCANE